MLGLLEGPRTGFTFCGYYVKMLLFCKFSASLYVLIAVELCSTTDINWYPHMSTLFLQLSYIFEEKNGFTHSFLREGFLFLYSLCFFWLLVLGFHCSFVIKDDIWT